MTDIKNKLFSAIADFAELPIESIKPESLLKQLVSDSFKIIELITVLEETFKVQIEQEDLRNLTTTGELVDLFSKKLTL